MKIDTNNHTFSENADNFREGIIPPVMVTLPTTNVTVGIPQEGGNSNSSSNSTINADCDDDNDDNCYVQGDDDIFNFNRTFHLIILHIKLKENSK